MLLVFLLILSCVCVNFWTNSTTIWHLLLFFSCGHLKLFQMMSRKRSENNMKSYNITFFYVRHIFKLEERRWLKDLIFFLYVWTWYLWVLLHWMGKKGTRNFFLDNVQKNSDLIQLKFVKFSLCDTFLSLFVEECGVVLHHITRPATFRVRRIQH